MRRLLPLVLVVATGGSASAAGLGGGLTLGGSYQRADLAGSDGGGSASSFDWEGEASLAGTPLRPDLLMLTGQGGYRTLHSVDLVAPSSSDHWNYLLDAAILSGFPLKLSLNALRGWSQFSTAGSRLGSALTSTESASLSLGLEKLPTLTARVSHSGLANHTLEGPVLRGDSTALSVGMSQSAGPLGFSLGYDTAWSGGDSVETNYRHHALLASGTARVSRAVQLHLSERYGLRLPTIEAPSNPRFDDNAFSAGLLLTPGKKLSATVDYTYLRSLMSAPERAAASVLSNSVGASASYQLDPSWRLSANASYAAGETSLGDQRRSLQAESTGAGVFFQRGLGKVASVNLGGNGSVGAVEQRGGPVLPSWGAGGQGGVALKLGASSGSASYAGSYRENGATLLGHSLDHRFDVTLEHAFRSVRVTGRYAFLLTSRDDALLGKSSSQSHTVTAQAAWRRYQLQLSAGDTSGLSAALARPDFGDPGLSPTSFNTETRYASVTASAVWGPLFVSLVGRGLLVDNPDLPRQQEAGADLVARYTLGAWAFSLEDHFSSGGYGEAWKRGNVAMVRVSRSFGFAF